MAHLQTPVQGFQPPTPLRGIRTVAPLLDRRFSIPDLERIMRIEFPARLHDIVCASAHPKNAPALALDLAVRGEVEMFLAADNPHMACMARLAAEHLSKTLIQKGAISLPSTDLYVLIKSALRLDQTTSRVQRLRHTLVFDCWQYHIQNMVATTAKSADPEVEKAVKVFLHVLKLVDHALGKARH